MQSKLVPNASVGGAVLALATLKATGKIHSRQRCKDAPGCVCTFVFLRSERWSLRCTFVSEQDRVSSASNQTGK